MNLFFYQFNFNQLIFFTKVKLCIMNDISIILKMSLMTFEVIKCKSVIDCYF